MTPAEELVRRSCAEQGLPLTLEDPLTLQRVAAIFAPAVSLKKDRPAGYPPAGRSGQEAVADDDYPRRSA